jgi:molybdopterin biosynthesis enzyme
MSSRIAIGTRSKQNATTETIKTTQKKTSSSITLTMAEEARANALTAQLPPVRRAAAAGAAARDERAKFISVKVEDEIFKGKKTRPRKRKKGKV